MRRHEPTCTANPTRAACGMCKAAFQSPPSVAELVAALGRGDAEGLAEVQALADGCPACVLTAIRQSKLQRAPSGDPIDPENPGFRVDFDFAAAKKEWWDEINNRNDYNDY